MLKVPKTRNLVWSNEYDLNVVVADVLDWLTRPGNVDWLLLFDNVDQDHKPDFAIGAYGGRWYLPGDHGSVLITTSAVTIGAARGNPNG
jgi:hypothetical protein